MTQYDIIKQDPKVATLTGHVLMAIDDNEASDYAVRWAVQNIIKKDDPLSLLHIYENERDAYGLHIEGTGEKSAIDVLLRKSKIVQEYYHENKIHGHVVPSQQVRAAIKQFCRERQCQYLVVGRRKIGALARISGGSTSENCVHFARCPVLVVKHSPEEDLTSSGWKGSGGGVGGTGRGKRLKAVMAIDTSQECQEAAKFFLSQPSIQSSELVFVHAIKSNKSKHNTQEVFALYKELASLHGKSADLSFEQVVGPLGKTVVSFVSEKEADVLLVGCRGLGQIKRQLLGSFSDYCLKNAPCPVWVFKYSTKYDITSEGSYRKLSEESAGAAVVLHPPK